MQAGDPTALAIFVAPLLAVLIGVVFWSHGRRPVALAVVVMSVGFAVFAHAGLGATCSINASECGGAFAAMLIAGILWLFAVLAAFVLFGGVTRRGRL